MPRELYLTETPLMEPLIIGLCITKNESTLAAEWLQRYLPCMDWLYVLDGSSNSKTKIECMKYDIITYVSEKELEERLGRPLNKTDYGLRKPLLELIQNDFGPGNWVMLVHFDEFLHHNPRLVATLCKATGERRVQWSALHVIPHPDEYDAWKRCSDSDREKPWELFKHYHHNGPTENPYLEDRMWLLAAEDRYDPETVQGTTIPNTVIVRDSVAPYHPAYIHYKIPSIDPSKYEGSGRFKERFEDVKTGAGAVGVNRRNIRSPADLFFDTYPPFKYQSIYNPAVPKVGTCGRVDALWDMGSDYTSQVGPKSAQLPPLHIVCLCDSEAEAEDAGRYFASVYKRFASAELRCAISKDTTEYLTSHMYNMAFENMVKDEFCWVVPAPIFVNGMGPALIMAYMRHAQKGMGFVFSSVADRKRPGTLSFVMRPADFDMIGGFAEDVAQPKAGTDFALRASRHLTLHMIRDTSKISLGSVPPPTYTKLKPYDIDPTRTVERK